jgi:rhodanese-related sulfurtransferase
MIPEVSPRELAAELVSEHPPTLVDVRELDELEICRMPGALHIPMMEIPNRLDELKPDADLVIVCHVGGRSARVTWYLLRHGYSRVRNLSTGIDGWARDVDSSIALY